MRERFCCWFTPAVVHLGPPMASRLSKMSDPGTRRALLTRGRHSSGPPQRTSTFITSRSFYHAKPNTKYGYTFKHETRSLPHSSSHSHTSYQPRASAYSPSFRHPHSLHSPSPRSRRREHSLHRERPCPHHSRRFRQFVFDSIGVPVGPITRRGRRRCRHDWRSNGRTRETRRRRRWGESRARGQGFDTVGSRGG